MNALKIALQGLLPLDPESVATQGLLAEIISATGGGGGGTRKKSKRKIYIINGIRYLVPDDEDIKIEQQEPEIVENNYVEEVKSVDLDNYKYVRSAMISRAIPVVKERSTEKQKTPFSKQHEYEEEELLLMMF